MYRLSETAWKITGIPSEGLLRKGNGQKLANVAETLRGTFFLVVNSRPLPPGQRSPTPYLTMQRPKNKTGSFLERRWRGVRLFAL